MKDNYDTKAVKLIHVRGLGFHCLLDASRKYNLIDTCVFNLLKGRVKSTLIEDRMQQEEYDALIKSVPFDAPLYYDEDLYTVLGYKFVWRKWRPALLKRIMLNFEIDEQKYCEEFLVDRAVCDLNKESGEPVVAIFGENFNMKKSEVFNVCLW